MRQSDSLSEKQRFFCSKNFATDQNIVTFKVEDAVRYLERQKIYVAQLCCMIEGAFEKFCGFNATLLYACTHSSHCTAQ